MPGLDVLDSKRRIVTPLALHSFLKVHQTLSRINDQNLVINLDILPIIDRPKNRIFVQVNLVKLVAGQVQKVTKIFFQYLVLLD